MTEELPKCWVWKLDQHLGQFKYGFAEVFYRCLLSYNLGVDDKGVYVSIDTKEKIKINHLKCMIRNDYIASGHGELSGSKLCDLIIRFLYDVIEAVNRMVKGPGVIRYGEFMLSDSYL